MKNRPIFLAVRLASPAGSDQKKYGELTRADGAGLQQVSDASRGRTGHRPRLIFSKHPEFDYFPPLPPLRSDTCGFAFPEPAPPHSGM